MSASRCVALLRGVNVGGKNKLPMADLRAAMAPRFGDVETYIASGNVLFDLPPAMTAAEGETAIAELIGTSFGLEVPVVIRTVAQMRSTIEQAPEGFGENPEKFHSDAVFLKSPLTSEQVMSISRCARASTRPGRERASSTSPG
ncbi:MAG: DUF1697 domain-containing protein [Acidimicrobiales bacterium]|nr:DUF1697 domain-containing protein [Acidimicrobiales bacterium]